jgi:hypothetical protein
LPALLACAILLGIGRGGIAQPGPQAGTLHLVVLEPPPLVRLAGRLASDADQPTRQEFVLISLHALRDNYLHELEAAALERPRSRERKAKLARWQRATGELVAHLDRVIASLLQGADTRIQVDSARQVILFVDATPVLISTPRATAERALEVRILDRFCAFNDCSFLHADGAPAGRAAATPAGAWQLSQDAGPTYQIGGRINCEFADIDARRAKAALCGRIYEELQRLSADLTAARRRGHAVDWRLLASQRPQGVDAPVIRLNGSGAYLRLSLPLIGRLSATDWQRTAAWLQRQSEGDSSALLLRDMHGLL